MLVNPIIDCQSRTSTFQALNSQSLCAERNAAAAPSINLVSHERSNRVPQAV